MGDEHDPELCHVEPCAECARVYAERERTLPVKKAAPKLGKVCAWCKRPWSEHLTSEVDVCIHGMRRTP